MNALSEYSCPTAAPRLLCIGTALADSIIRGFDPEPISVSGYRAESGTLHTGGEALNEAVTAARLNLRTSILCGLGDDAAGQMILSVLRNAGVDTSCVFFPEDMQTPVSTLFVHADGSRKSITNRAHFYNCHPETRLPDLSGFDAVSMASLYRAPFDDPGVSFAVASAVRAAGLPLFADTKLPNSKPMTISDLADTLSLADYIFPNRDEAAFFSGKTDPEAMADVFLSFGVKNAVIKLGAEGCLLKNEAETLYLPAFPVPAVDATGAGDAFIAGFIASVLDGTSAADALLFANACGALSTLSVGAGSGIRSRGQVERFLSENRAALR